MEKKAFDNVKGQIGYCGLWCGSCIVGNGTLQELTKRYRQLVKGYGIDGWGLEERGMEGEPFINTLIAIENIPVCLGCWKGGGNDTCTMRLCAREKNVSDCIECREKATCMNLAPLERVRTGAASVGMLMKCESGNPDIEKWTADIRKKFPHCLIGASKS